MTIDYLFRFDGAKDNDKFFEGAKKRGIDNVYAGIEIEVGPGWIPDFLMVSRDDTERHCTLTLIELESRKMDALASSRKYLPESSAEILKAFHSYLNRVLEQCRSTADPRIHVVEDLQAFLKKASRIIIETACALRSDPTYLERLPLTDQPQTGALHYLHSPSHESSPNLNVSPLTFEGQRSLTRDETVGLNRAILILDAVVRQLDHSAAGLKVWTSSKRNPLHKIISRSQKEFPELSEFLSWDKHSGVKITWAPLFAELSTFWSDKTDKQISREKVHRLISEYYPIACRLSMRDRMQEVFEKAKRFVKEVGDGAKSH